ncbi:phosphate transport system regulatory protein PhoU [Mycobacterium persicum]|uniref:Phosphate-specific transport system accessory protein PhoU n=1 Tax=Mycobacterium persicum TaxID=1487726 RepID=A0A8E2ISD9_9MYCO|nr:phosphate signaling complex protein PhoU [Mycobacterium persicum]KZS82034.1 phosphate transport system regulatory protein PhoU [Mycobacterium persicum]ORB46867.1 phosphate transport system regulatory protein PhoU [Mycobacterium persicum]ORB96270.1 phosphate transport system regulatory protein PhoU [Mycobacterium persicum]ORC02985.1 phosphate transport system regulatory protein PhoU [Mycobacterium persicum]ORC08290.1 phosphate transport system regulatory protein PhoU [Mycobacterium persicum]
MRTVYHERLTDLADQLGRLCGLTAAAMERATRALLQADAAAALQVISDHDHMAALRNHAEESAFSLLALQQPVAGELRSIVGSIQVVADLDRMDALAVHVAKIVQQRQPDRVLPTDVEHHFAEMGGAAVELAHCAQEVVMTRNAEMAAHIREQDDEMDELHRQLLTTLMDRDWKHGVKSAVDIALLGRFYERFADHAVEIGRRVVFEATGALLPEQEIGTY